MVRMKLLLYTHQICNSFFDDISNVDMVQFVVLAQPANDEGFTHSRWTKYTDPDRLKRNEMQ